MAKPLEIEPNREKRMLADGSTAYTMGVADAHFRPMAGLQDSQIMDDFELFKDTSCRLIPCATDKDPEHRHSHSRGKLTGRRRNAAEERKAFKGEAQRKENCKLRQRIAVPVHGCDRHRTWVSKDTTRDSLSDAEVHEEKDKLQLYRGQIELLGQALAEMAVVGLRDRECGVL
ncbi:uncharacterized protein CC84DRAFT_1207797 [Paraphaeosphaeria sporulosa]|uniref:Uncharacterized protein n=1 Tax=Paraphaeosphaeria sporulosa TaxID=1460663 RepID=A0A177C5J4_9PLEO|nr:uncharacterized protein CC84DRAFT_1207797 [Paraphaeosphaeria sporulosa]OAG03024.1 hypothetical protein CC84DRAFT_1207797 [Paraphaeosphaeria sporulosa]